MDAEIGDAAGRIWRALSDSGPMSKARIVKATGLSADLVNQGIGWLVREGKLEREQMAKGGQTIRLRP